MSKRVVCLRFVLGAVSLLALSACPRARTARGVEAAVDAPPTWHRGEACAMGDASHTAQMVASISATCALRGDGSVWCAGYDEHGEVSGRPESVARNTYRAFKRVDGVAGAVQLAAASGTVCARLSGGGVTCWGENMHGALGLGDRNWNHRPTPVAHLTEAVEIAAGGGHFCARRRDGTVWCWGSNARGELGRPPSGANCGMSSTTLVQCGPDAQAVAGLSDVRALALGGFMGFQSYSCAIKNDGTAWCWGSNEGRIFANIDAGAANPTPTQVAGVTDAEAIVPGATGACVRRRGGAWWCFGDNHVNGEVLAPAAAPAFQGAAVVAMNGAVHCRLSAEGALDCSNERAYGRFTPEQTSRPMQWNLRGLGAVDGVAMSLAHACAWRCSGEAFCWGADERGQLGDGSLRSAEAPQALSGLFNIRQIAAGPHGACAVEHDGGLRCWGAIPGRFEEAVGEVRPWVMPTSVPRKLAGISRVAEAAVGDGFVCVRLTDATVQCWGKNDRGQLGSARGADRPTPEAVPGLSGVVQLVAGANHACARLQDDTVRCWGSNERGQLGDGSRREHVGLVTPVGVGPVASVVTAFEQSCAVRADGAVWCWGHDFVPLGGEGEGDTDTPRPHAMRELTNVASLSMIEYVGCALLRDGAVRCVRDGVVTPDGPERALRDVTVLGGGEDSMCAVMRDGSAVCLDENSTPPDARTHAFAALSGAVQLVSGSGFACARMSDGAVRCWGRDDDGTLGLGRTMDFPAMAVPTPVRWASP